MAGVAVDSRDRVYVFNRGRHPVIVFDKEGQFLDAWGEGMFTRPHGIFITRQDQIFLVDDEGRLVSRNDVAAVSLEHKLGIHASPTCVMAFGEAEGAIGWLVGEENRGLEYMFTMMNHARQAVGLQGLAIAERAYQQALNYSRERVQGKPLGWSGDGTPGIVHHPDVRRMLLGMKSRIEAMRGIAPQLGLDGRLAAPPSA